MHVMYFKMVDSAFTTFLFGSVSNKIYIFYIGSQSSVINVIFYADI